MSSSKSAIGRVCNALRLVSPGLFRPGGVRGLADAASIGCTRVLARPKNPSPILRRSHCRHALALALAGALLLALSACGDLPQPYRGRPGGQAGVLAIPLAVRLAVRPPDEAMLPGKAAEAYAEAITSALQAQDVPAIATPTPLPLDWQVEATAERRGQEVVPRFRLLDADRKPQAATEGSPVPVRDWAEAERPLFDRVAQEAAPKLTQLLLQVEAARKSTDPASLTAGPPKLHMVGVKGAPGDGNTSLGTRMREQLGNQGFVVQETAEGAAYALQAEVSVVPTPVQGVERVEIQWIVSRRDGEELGRVVQMNEVPAGRLNRLWGDIAYIAAEEAAGGVKTVVSNAMTAPPTTTDAPKPAGPQASSTPPAPPILR
ncbi:hypothetical protein [Paracraurococcus lichenis]|uniref:DUF4410 domain-containing protein n=1 Tax=Paracraurococcus lichenis TaxID=3064888 RepID=A0ABT9E124_9PROT|nr:hypothetical protein [Paracraurococcus sp. LOR1-02]MDO9709805.1 hypothetical protein [Paracraurococcus sp. LOR1-02]